MSDAQLDQAAALADAFYEAAAAHGWNSDPVSFACVVTCSESFELANAA